MKDYLLDYMYSIPGLICYHDAQYPLGINITPYTSNYQFSLNDKIVNLTGDERFDLMYYNGFNRSGIFNLDPPVYKTDGLNNQPYIRIVNSGLFFDNTGEDWTSSGAWDTERTIFIAMQWSSSFSGAYYMDIFSGANGTGSIRTKDSGNGQMWFTYSVNNNYLTISGDFYKSAPRKLLNFLMILREKNGYGLDLSGGFNKTEIIKPSVSNYTLTPLNSLHRFCIGFAADYAGSGGGSYPRGGSGKLYSHGIVNRYITDQEVNRIFSFWKTKYNI